MPHSINDLRVDHQRGVAKSVRDISEYQNLIHE